MSGTIAFTGQTLRPTRGHLAGCCHFILKARETVPGLETGHVGGMGRVVNWSAFEWGGDAEWSRVSRGGGAVILALYVLFLVYAARDSSGFLFPDNVNLMIHEAGHLFFSWSGRTLMLLGGTLGELIVPALCAAFFVSHRQTYGLVFSLFWFFENFLYIGTYMADARAHSLPLVNSDIGDWTILFGQWGIPEYDQKIGHFVRFLGWIGMVSVVGWLAYRLYRDAYPPSELRPLEM